MNGKDIENKHKDNVYYKQNPEMFMQLASIVEDNRDTYVHKLKMKMFGSLKTWIRSQLNFLDNKHFCIDDYPMKEMVYLILNGMQDFPKCAICGKPLDNSDKFVSAVKGFLLCCSRDCSSIRRQNSFKMTSLVIYGVSHPLKSERGYTHYCDALEEHHGVRNVFQMEKTKSRIKATKKERHGSENYVNVEKSRQTRHLNFNGCWESASSGQKRKSTFEKHYGVDNNMKCEAGLHEY